MITKQEFLTKYKDLCEYFGKSITVKAADIWYGRINAFNYKDITYSFNRCIEQEKTMPVLSTFLDYLEDSKKYHEKREYFKPSYEEKKHNPELARDCREYIEMLFQFRPGSEEKKKFMKDWALLMNRKYPHLEF